MQHTYDPILVGLQKQPHASSTKDVEQRLLVMSGGDVSQRKLKERLDGGERCLGALDKSGDARLDFLDPGVPQFILEGFYGEQLFRVPIVRGPLKEMNLTATAASIHHNTIVTLHCKGIQETTT